MRAYAVFAGGGVKGAALAGCLAAAQNWQIDFRGYGGTSAGSIIALLGAVGLRGEDIGRLLIEKPFTEFLDDGGPKLSEFVSQAKSIHTNDALAIFGSAPAACALHRTMRKTYGLYNGSRLVDYLWGLIRDQLQLTDSDREGFTFEYLHVRKGPQLKIVASDISRRCPVLFPRDCCSYGSDILNAVRASAGFPFVFEPLRIDRGYLVDGGVASNLPAFLFAAESAETRFPTLAFDLVQDRVTSINRLAHFMREGFFTCLEASDILLRELSPSVFHIPIQIPAEIHTLDFDISKAAKQGLFDSAYRQTDEFLNTLPRMVASRDTSLSAQKQLMAQYGDPKFYVPALNALVRDIETNSGAKYCRANIMLDTGRSRRVVVYQVGMDNDPDQALDLPEAGGCSGRAWKTRRPAWADLVEARENGGWGMERELHNQVRADRKSMISVAIPSKTGALGAEGDASMHPVGTLSVDSSTPLADTLWLEGDSVKQHIEDIMGSWAAIVARILP